MNVLPFFCCSSVSINPPRIITCNVPVPVCGEGKRAAQWRGGTHTPHDDYGDAR